MGSFFRTFLVAAGVVVAMVGIAPSDARAERPSFQIGPLSPDAAHVTGSILTYGGFIVVPSILFATQDDPSLLPYAVAVGSLLIGPSIAHLLMGDVHGAFLGRAPWRLLAGAATAACIFGAVYLGNGFLAAASVASFLTYGAFAVVDLHMVSADGHAYGRNSPASEAEPQVAITPFGITGTF